MYEDHSGVWVGWFFDVFDFDIVETILQVFLWYESVAWVFIFDVGEFFSGADGVILANVGNIQFFIFLFIEGTDMYGKDTIIWVKVDAAIFATFDTEFAS